MTGYFEANGYALRDTLLSILRDGCRSKVDDNNNNNDNNNNDNNNKTVSIDLRIAIIRLLNVIVDTQPSLTILLFDITDKDNSKD